MRNKAIFRDPADRARFIYILLECQFEEALNNVSRNSKKLLKEKKLILKEKIGQRKKLIALHFFILMDNHYHLSVQEIVDTGISTYMQKVMTSYAKYFNLKYKESGHLFEGPFQAIHVKTNNQLLHLSAYIHKNCSNIKGWKGREENYFWSSYWDHVRENRWGSYLDTTPILEQFATPKEYETFVTETEIKEKDREPD